MFPSLLSDPYLHPVCVGAICPLGNTVLLCFISDIDLVFKILNFRDPALTVLILWGTVSLCCDWYCFAQKSNHTTSKGLDSVVKYSKMLQSRLAAFRMTLYTYANEWGSLLALNWVLCPLRSSVSSPKCPARMGNVFPRVTQSSLSSFNPLFSFSTRAPLCLPGLTLMMAQTSKTSDFQLHVL